MNADKIVVGLAGMPGSGKSLVVETAQELGYAIVGMGDVIREETAKRGLELTPQNVGKVMLQLREAGGNSIIAQKCIPKIEEQTSTKVLVDGLRSMYEADAFKAHFAKFTLVAVHASPETRFNRLFNRRRSDDPDRWEVFRDRDMRELNVGVGNVIAMAEQIIVNDNSMEQVKAKVVKTLQRIEKKWMK
ncbi:flagellar hook-basal body complex protein FliE [Candidatus Bathyarchaeota archaeon]|nr:flagellar hook-basal body complex protein FliE [Candidatus Bathyarchaeota archaeon]